MNDIILLKQKKQPWSVDVLSKVTCPFRVNFDQLSDIKTDMEMR